MLKRLLCLLLGHRFAFIGIHPNGIWVCRCDRCGLDTSLYRAEHGYGGTVRSRP